MLHNSHVYDSLISWFKIILYFNWHNSEWIYVFRYQTWPIVNVFSPLLVLRILSICLTQERKSFQFSHIQVKVSSEHLNSIFFLEKIIAIFQFDLFVKCSCFILMWRERLCLFMTNTNRVIFFFLCGNNFSKINFKTPSAVAFWLNFSFILIFKQLYIII